MLLNRFTLLFAIGILSGSAAQTLDYTSPSAFKTSVLNSTNFYRAEHNASEVVWNDTLASYAEDYASECKFAHSGGPYGENLAAGYANATASVEVWGNEGSNYDFGAGQFDSSTGHFTQLVWKGTNSTGCAAVNCSGENGTPGWYVVCEYWPPGNVIGSFTTNVQAGTGASGAGGLSLGLTGACLMAIGLWMSIELVS